MSEQWGTLIPYFREFKRNQIDKIKKISKVFPCKGGDLIFLQGEFCNSWVIINKGSFLTRKTKEDNSVEESILHEGDSFDLVSILDSSVTSCILESIEESSVLVISIPGLKSLVKKFPEILSMIKEKMPESEGFVWNKYFFNKETGIKDKVLKIRESLLSILIKNIPVVMIFIILLTTTFIFISTSKAIITLTASILLFLSLLVQYLLKRLVFIEVNRESITKRSLSIKGVTSVNTSVPVHKISGSKISYRNRLCRILNLGSICFESPVQELTISGVYRPELVQSTIDSYKRKTADINKGIEVSSFKSTYCRQNNLFHIDCQLEDRSNGDFVFRKSILSFLVIGLPPSIFLTLTSLGLFFIFEVHTILYLNVISFAYFSWHFWDWLNDRYAFEGSKVVDIEKKPLWGRESRVEADISSVQSIRKEQKNIMELLFNFGTIEIETLGDKIVYPFIHNPDRIIENLYLVKQFYCSKQESINKLQRQEEFLNYTKYYQELSRK